MKIVRSSEISNYLFCPVSWWIGKTKGIKITKAINEGEKYHKIVSENQVKAKFLYASMVITILIIIFLMIYRFLG